jgi:DDE superfamily endonuclease
VIPKAGPDYVCAMEAVLDVYERAYRKSHPVVAIDESPQQLISQARIGFTDSNGVYYEDYEYIREGVVDLYMVCEPLAGRREIFVKDNHNRLNWAEIVRIVAEDMYPEAEQITIICDNLTAHKPSALYEILPPERARHILRRIEFVNTPKHGSWLNVAENELSVLKRVGIAKRVGSREELEKQIADYQERRNKKGVKVEWQFTTKDARVKLKRLYPPLKP